jgi:hypothetical protein
LPLLLIDALPDFFELSGLDLLGPWMLYGLIVRMSVLNRFPTTLLSKL